MKIIVNGKPYSTGAATLKALKEELCIPSDITILNGFQTTQNLELKENDCVTLIQKGKMPSKTELESMMCARHTPNVHSKVKKAKVAIAGLGGLYFVMDYTSGVWTNGGFGDRGWLAIALVIFALWKPNVSVIGSILFGGLYVIYLFIPDLARSTQELFKMLPYVVTIIVLIVVSMRKKREYQPPEHLGLSYFREER